MIPPPAPAPPPPEADPPVAETAGPRSAPMKQERALFSPSHIVRFVTAAPWIVPLSRREAQVVG